MSSVQPKIDPVKAEVAAKERGYEVMPLSSRETKYLKSFDRVDVYITTGSGGVSRRQKNPAKTGNAHLNNPTQSMTTHFGCKAYAFWLTSINS